jgi:hypothetical protein
MFEGSICCNRGEEPNLVTILDPELADCGSTAFSITSLETTRTEHAAKRRRCLKIAAEIPDMSLATEVCTK